MSEVEKAEYRRLQGAWKVGSAAFQMGGPIFYTFDNGILVIERRSIVNAKGGVKGPVTVTIERYDYRLRTNLIPKQIVLTPINGDREKQQTSIYEFRDDRLWMCPDDGPTRKNRTSLVNDQFGDGWLVGLERIKQQ